MKIKTTPMMVKMESCAKIQAKKDNKADTVDWMKFALAETRQNMASQNGIKRHFVPKSYATVNIKITRTVE